MVIGVALAAPALGAPRIVAARGQWAALSEGRTCEAATRSSFAPQKDRPPARASLSFDAGGPRHGQFAVRLSRPAVAGGAVMLTIADAKFLLMGQGDMAWSRGPAQEQAIIAAIRAAPALSVEARSETGGRFVDRFSLSGAPLAIDAAAACAARLANR